MPRFSPSRPRRAAAAVLAGAVLLGGGAVTAQAGQLFLYREHKVPTNDSEPRYITTGPDGNLWFTGSGQVFVPNADPDTGGTFLSHIGRVTPSGDITEFPVDCDSCFLDDIEGGVAGDALYFTGATFPPRLGRITTDGAVNFIAPRDAAGTPLSIDIAGRLDSSGDGVWGSSDDTIWRYDTGEGHFEEFAVPNVNGQVAVNDRTGVVWYIADGAEIGSFDPATGVVGPTTPVPDDVIPGGQGSSPSDLAIGSDEKVWFTDRSNDSVGYVDPKAGVLEVTQFGTLSPNSGPQDIAAAEGGTMWFAQADIGNVARITPEGAITEAGRGGGDDPDSPHENALGVAFLVDPDGAEGKESASVWFTRQAANEIAAVTQK